METIWSFLGDYETFTFQYLESLFHEQIKNSRHPIFPDTILVHPQQYHDYKASAQSRMPFIDEHPLPEYTLQYGGHKIKFIVINSYFQSLAERLDQ